MATRLKIDDLQVVKNDLWDARTKWINFGLALLMKKSTLDSIDITQRGDPGDCLRELLAEWLRGAGDPPRTWSTIVAALAKVESLEALAEEVGGKHNVAYKATTRTNSAQGIKPHSDCLTSPKIHTLIHNEYYCGKVSRGSILWMCDILTLCGLGAHDNIVPLYA